MLFLTSKIILIQLFQRPFIMLKQLLRLLYNSIDDFISVNQKYINFLVSRAGWGEVDAVGADGAWGGRLHAGEVLKAGYGLL